MNFIDLNVTDFTLKNLNIQIKKISALNANNVKKNILNEQILAKLFIYAYKSMHDNINYTSDKA